MKKWSIFLVLLLVGCAQNNYVQNEKVSLLDEIAEIENELNKELEQVDDVVEEEIEVSFEENNNGDSEVNVGDKDINTDGVVDEGVNDGSDITEVGAASEDNDIDNGVVTITVDENQIVRLKPTITDKDNDVITHAFSAPLSAEGEWKTNYGDAGEYMATLTASDGRLTSERQIRIIVNRVNVPPVITGVQDIHVEEGAVVNLNPLVSDPNNDKVEITISGPLVSGEFVTDHTSAGEYVITVSATDGELTTEESINLKVDDVNVLPVISNIENLVVKEGDEVIIKPEVNDLDGDEIELTIADPVGNDGNWQTSFVDHGQYTITVSANDGKDIVTRSINLIVEDVNVAPEIVNIELVVN